MRATGKQLHATGTEAHPATGEVARPHAARSARPPPARPQRCPHAGHRARAPASHGLTPSSVARASTRRRRASCAAHATRHSSARLAGDADRTQDSPPCRYAPSSAVCAYGRCPRRLTCHPRTMPPHNCRAPRPHPDALSPTRVEALSPTARGTHCAWAHTRLQPAPAARLP